jgi:hypothetical protein
MTCLKLAVGSNLLAIRSMLELHRLTTEYIQIEDRFRLTGEDQQGRALCLWLTQRLAIRIVVHLVDAIATSSPEAIQNPSQDQDVSKLLQGFAQQAAAADLSPQVAVQSSAAKQSMLINEVDVTRGEGGVVSLVFRNHEDTKVALSFQLQQLRQWLSIIHAQWIKAEWPNSIWPEWIGEKAQPVDSTDPSNPLH